MEAFLITLLLMVVAGAAGALTRVLLQRFREGTWPSSWWVQLILGAIAGWLSWEIPNYLPDWTNLGRLGAWALGFVFPDVAENLAQIWSRLQEG